MSYYKENKQYLNECRKLNYIISKWDFINTKEEARIWLKHRSIYKSIIKNKENIDQTEFLSLLLQILES